MNGHNSFLSTNRELVLQTARNTLQVRWAYQASRLESAIITGSQQGQDKAMAALVAIEIEAIKAGVIDDLDMGDVDGAVPKYRGMDAKTATGHHAQITGGYSKLNPLVWIPRSQQRGDGTELEISEIQKFELQEQERDYMALGKRIEAPTSQQFQHPVSQVGANVGRPLVSAAAKPPATKDNDGTGAIGTLNVSKAERLKAMKKAVAGATVAGKEKANEKLSLVPKKAKMITKCLDGCGADVGGRFAIGHDAKLKSVLVKIERGIEDISSVPEIARPFVTFSKPVKVASEDGKGQVLTYQLLRAPVRMAGRVDVEYVQDLGEGYGGK